MRVGPRWPGTGHQRAQVDAFISQSCGFNLDARFDQRHRALHVFATIERNSGGDPLFQDATYHQFVPPRMKARILDIAIVLIGPEPVYITVGLALAEHAASRRTPLVDGILPVLDANEASKDGVIVIRHIPSGIDSFHLRLAVLVDDDAILDLHIGACQNISNGLYPDADHDEITVEPPATAGHHTLHMALAFKGRHRLLKEHLHPV